MIPKDLYPEFEIGDLASDRGFLKDNDKVLVIGKSESLKSGTIVYRVLKCDRHGIPMLYSCGAFWLRPIK